MKVITVCSAKGGVGKTTVTANLGVGIAQRGFPVLLIDLDSQNALRWHLGGVDEADVDGISAMGVLQRKLTDAVFVSPFGVDFIPYGIVDEPHRKAFEQYLAHDPDWLISALVHAGLPSNTIVLLDTPPGPTVYLKQALRASHFALLVILADMASYTTVNALELLIRDFSQGNPSFIGSAYVLNQGGSSQLATDVIATLRAHYGIRVLPDTIRQSGEVEDALAFERPLLHYNPECDAAVDMQRMVDWIINFLNRF